MASVITDLVVWNISSTDVIVEVDTIDRNKKQKIERHVETLSGLKVWENFLPPLTIKRKAWIRDADNNKKLDSLEIEYEAYLIYRSAIMVFDDPLDGGRVRARQIGLDDLPTLKASYAEKVADKAREKGLDPDLFTQEYRAEDHEQQENLSHSSD